MYLMRFYGFGRGMYWMWDPTYLLIVIGVVLSMVASAMVHSSFSKYSQGRSASGLTGADSVYGSNSVAAIAVAAHECGHVIQHANSYAPLSIRSALVPVANFGSGASWFIILAGIFFSMPPLVTIGIVLFSAAVLFQVVTLPVEINASRRALAILEECGILGSTEGRGAKRVLRAAALTYVASSAAAILQLLRLIILFGRNSRD